MSRFWDMGYSSEARTAFHHALLAVTAPRTHAHVMHMCYHPIMAKTSESASARTVVLLRPKERKHLEKLAAKEHVSSGEILRRSLHAYEDQTSKAEQETLAVLLSQMNTALDEALASIRSARSEIQQNLKKIQSMQESKA